ncbi:cache domain-containing protein [Roseivivax isoporae]|uniref:Cache domain-containing protein n=1 Tax=Roseivivax isoporae LMG 25204 TaxID=1449351 RepID=X7FA25_9RHOB|nr:cache domain-containing protein [Roseivivax isoporae]ETX28944.1 hypothetical protein RISW2_04315 [Roseivivax isoporae LMG 25204]
MERNRAQGPKLATVLVWCNALILGAALVAGFVWLQRNADRHHVQVQEAAALRGAEALSLAFSEAVEREWQSLRAIAGTLGDATPEVTRAFIDAVGKASPAIAWVGLADPSGRVIAGTGGANEGTDVSGRRWHREGLRGESSGSVFADTFDGADAGQEFVNLSMPVRNAEGEVTGVAVYRLRMSWVDDYLSIAADSLDLDAFLLGRDGTVVAGTADRFGADLTREELLQAGLQPVRGTVVDGNEERGFVSASLGRVAGPHVPDFGWSLLVRVPSDPAGRPLISWDVVGISTVALMMVVIVALMWALNRHFVQPIEELADCATALGDGKLVFPRERGASTEAAVLSQALARIQTILQSGSSADGYGRGEDGSGA